MGLEDFKSPATAGKWARIAFVETVPVRKVLKMAKIQAMERAR